jgi:hypothetical protein
MIVLLHFQYNCVESLNHQNKNFLTAMKDVM